MTVPTSWLETEGGRRWPMIGSCALGRSSTNDVVIDDGRVSRRHALVHKQDDAEYWVIDLGSGNGTYLNGRRVTQPTRLADGDVLSLGDMTLTFRQITGRISSEARTAQSAQTLITFKSLPCWLLVADIKGSTALAQKLPPTDLAMLVGRWMGACKETVEAHGGSINKFLGDGFFAYWLAETTPEPRMSEAISALRQIQRDPASPAFRIVVHRGEVSLGGGGSLGEDSLTGLDVVTTFRMEKIAGELGCDLMASGEAKDALGQRFSWRDLGSHPVPGVGTPRRFFAA